jgi:hydroxymethylpyrimidine pyrophosphatase-like HAD family hydrolase
VVLECCWDAWTRGLDRRHVSTAQRTDFRTTGIAPRPAPGVHDAYRWALNPLQTFDSLLSIAQQLARAVPEPTDLLTGDPVTNLYMVVCGLDQILSDHQHRHFYELDRAAFPAPVRRALRRASGVQRSLRRASVITAGRRLDRVEEELLQLSRSIGRRLLEGRPTATHADAAAISRLAAGRYPGTLRRSLLKLPQSFRGVDLYPEDCELLARRALASAAGDETPLAVIGLRTSGLYMAPLCAAALDRLGHPHVELLSLRPGTPTHLAEERRLRAIAAAGGWAFVVDDPTWRGSALAKTFETLKSLGFPPGRLRLAACEIGNQPVFRLGKPGALSQVEQETVWTGFQDAQKVLLERSEWRIHAHLSDEAAERCLNRPQALARLDATRVTVRRGHPFSETGEPPAVTGLPSRRRQRRFHAQKVFEIEVERSGERSVELVVGRGVGVGFFGYHSYLVAQALAGLTPDLLGLENGVLFTRWEKGGRVEAGSLSRPDLDAVGQYIVRRAQALRLERNTRVPETRAIYSGARQVARMLGRSMGGVGALAQFRAADALSRHVAPPLPAAIDARMGPAEWVRNKSGDLVKVDFEEHCFDITDRWVIDPIHDVAAAGVGFRLDAASEARLVQDYAGATGDRDRLRARLAFHKMMAGLAELGAVTIEGYEPGSRVQRDSFARDLVAGEQAMTRTVNGYLAGLYLGDIHSRETGHIWALDLDDTLETDWLGFQATSPAGALALRTLAIHDQLVVASTGRSLAEVQDRCETYGIAGGIAEYGAVAWDARHRRSLPIITAESRRRLETLREAILDETDIVADPQYEHTLRLFRHTPDGRRGTKVEEISEVIERHRIEGLEVVEGFRKTVVWAAGCDKAQALQPLLGSLGVDRAARRLHVVGDEVTDLGLMALADRRHAPGNTTGAVRARAGELGVTTARRGRAAGVLEVVQHELHRSRGRCSACRRVELDRADEVLVELLGVQDRSRLARFAFALHPASLRAFEL